MNLCESFCFVGALCGGLSLVFFLLGLVTDHLWPRLAMRHRLAATRAPRVRVAGAVPSRRVQS